MRRTPSGFLLLKTKEKEMSYSYYGRQESLMKLMTGLAYTGWSIYGFHEDESDWMTDYFHPASWDGIAVKNGYILVVDCYGSGSIGGDFIKQSYDHKIAKRIEKLRALAECPSASEGERENALAMIEKIAPHMVVEETMKGNLPAVEYQKNPKGSKWHIERNGEIIAKGNGIYGFGSIETHKCRVIYDERENNDHDLFTYYNIDTWDDFIARRKEEREQEHKNNNKYFSLLNKWNSAVALKLGEGEEEALVKQTVMKEDIYFVPQVSKEPTDYIKLAPKWRRFSGMDQNLIYKLSEDKKTMRKLTQTWHKFSESLNIKGELDIALEGQSGRTYKPEPRKSTNPKFFYGSDEDFANGDIIYVRLVEVAETFETVVYAKEKTKTKKPATAKKNKSVVSKQVEAPKPTRTTEDQDFEALFHDGEISDFKHTQTGEMLKVLKLRAKLDRDAFIAFNIKMKKYKRGYYSKYAKGFIVTDESYLEDFAKAS